MDKGRFALALGKKMTEDHPTSVMVLNLSEISDEIGCSIVSVSVPDNAPIFNECFKVNIMPDYFKINPERRMDAIETLEKWITEELKNKPWFKGAKCLDAST